MKKLALGTAQFGLNYGIKNKSGQVAEEEVFRILDAAAASGIDTLDTAAAYGESETVLGKYLKDRTSRFKIVSKLPAKIDGDVRSEFAASLEKLGQESLYGYLFHDFNTYRQNPGIWDSLQELKAQGKVKKTGFSFYYPKDLEDALENNTVPDIVQVPYNLFDRRFESWFRVLKKNHVEVHVRSVFLQGLLLTDRKDLKPFFSKISPKIEAVKNIANELGVTPASLCLNFALGNEMIDRVVIGVDSLGDLEDNMESSRATAKVAASLSKLEFLREEDENILLPFNWR